MRTAARCVRLMVRRFFQHKVGVQSAALAFYLLFMIFPFLIFISALLGLLDLNVTAILLVLGEFLPREVVDIVQAYLLHVGQEPNVRLMLFGLFFSLWFPMRATSALMQAVRQAYHLGPPRREIIHWLKTLIYTVMLILTIAVTLAFMTVGDRLLSWLMVQFRLPVFWAELWRRLRFPAAGTAGYFALFFLYALSQDGVRPWQELWPGTAAALAAWLGLNWLYAEYVERFAHYSLLYGSIGAVIVLLIWLNMTAMVLILGAEFNGTLLSLRNEREKRGTPQ